MNTFLASAFLFFGFVANAQSQPLEVLLIGTSHRYNLTYNEDFAGIINKAVQFRPEAVFGEFLSADDYDGIPNYWNKTAMEKRFAYVKNVNYPAPRNPATLVRETTQFLREHPNDHQSRMKLARALYLTHDYGNARYQLYRLDKARPNFSPEEMAAYGQLLGSPDSLYVTRNNEYHNLAFPLIAQLNLDGILPMDSQRHDLTWQAAWDKAERLFKQWEAKLENDTTSADARRYAVLNQRVAELQREMNRAARAGESTAWLNSPNGDEYLNIVNFYGARRLFGTQDFPEKEIDAMLTQWQNRNDDMVRNTVARARQAGVRRVVVFVGANHRNVMVNGLRAVPGVTVYELNSL